MTFLGGLRLTTLGAATLLSLVVLGASAFLNSKSSPMFHYAMFTFPFAMSLITLAVIPTITLISLKTRNDPTTSRLAFLSAMTIELPLLVLFLLLWFICAHTGIAELFGPFRHCNRGQGVGVVAAGLAVPTYCKVVAVVHGSSWLACFMFLIICVFTGLFALVAVLRQGVSIRSIRDVQALRISELTVTGRPGAGSGKEVL